MTLLVVKILSVILMIVGITFIIPILAALCIGEYFVIPSFAVPMAVSVIAGLIFIFTGSRKKRTLSIRESFFVVASAWGVISLFGALPLYFSGAIPKFTDAFFESVSGFTTTGSTILEEIENLPRTINLWRCMTHWLGGMGIVALTVALLPILGVGGFQLIKAETTGPEKGKFTAKISNTAKILWFIYLGMTVIEAIILRMLGMDTIDAVTHAFSTLGTGGFSSKNASIGAYNSVAIDIVCTVFMFLAGINFSLYFYLFTRNYDELRNNTELKAYIGITITAVIALTVIQTKYFGGFFNSLRYCAFQVTSLLSTTGFATSDYALWHPASQAIIFCLFFIGGSSGSTAGGIKVIRWVILAKQMKNELLKNLHPHGVFSICLNKKAGRKDVVYAVSAFLICYCILLSVTTFIGCCFNIDLLTSFSGAFTMIGNVGPGFNMLGPSCNFGWLPSFVKIWYCFAMIAGRLELFTMFIFFVPDFWRK